MILAGGAGFALMYVAQTKVQVLNTYSGSLALSNLCYVLTGKHPNRLATVVVANAICLVMIAANVFGKLSGVLNVLGIVVMGFIALAIADFYIVSRSRQRDMSAEVEPVNWAGVLSLAVASTVAYVLYRTDVFQYGFVASAVLVVLIYPPLRLMVLKPAARGLAAPAPKVGAVP